MPRYDDDHDDPMIRDYAAWQRWQRDTTPIEYWHAVDLTFAAYTKTCEEARQETPKETLEETA